MLSSRLRLACAPAAENYHAYFVAAPPPTTEYLMPMAGHSDFVDTCADGGQDLICAVCPGAVDKAPLHDMAVALVTAFMRVHLAGDRDYQPWVDGPAIAAVPFVEVSRR